MGAGDHPNYASLERTLSGRFVLYSIAERLRFENLTKWAYCEIECIRGGNWSVREFNRQIGVLYFELHIEKLDLPFQLPVIETLACLVPGKLNEP